MGRLKVCIPGSAIFCSVFTNTNICTTPHCTETLCDTTHHQHTFLAYTHDKPSLVWSDFHVWCNNFNPISAQMLVMVRDLLTTEVIEA